MKCPVCDNESSSMLCLKCGFDGSTDYGKYPTLGPVGKVSAVSSKRKQWQNQQKSAKQGKLVKVNNNTIYHEIKVVPKNKWVAFVLCFFLGMFGAHKFYEGKKRMGILYLCTYGLFGFGWFFDWISLLFQPNPYFVLLGKKTKH